MAEGPFQPGDIVQLKSGGPKMTVIYSGPTKSSVIYYNPITGQITSGGYTEILNAVLTNEVIKD